MFPWMPIVPLSSMDGYDEYKNSHLVLIESGPCRMAVNSSGFGPVWHVFYAFDWEWTDRVLEMSGGPTPALPYSAEFTPVRTQVCSFPVAAVNVWLEETHGYKGWIEYSSYKKLDGRNYTWPAIQAFDSLDGTWYSRRDSVIQFDHVYKFIYYQLQIVED